jgi:hypothetical protein
MLRNVLIGLVALVVLIVGVGYLIPGRVEVSRTVTIDAPAEVIFPYINDYRRFNEWSPWADRDPDAVYTFEGPDAGVGARMSWQGGESVGAGSQEITLSEFPTRLETHLDFEGEGFADAYFTLVPAEGGGTDVTWGFTTHMGPNPIAHYLGLMMDGWVGADYEAGLENLRVLVEAETQDAGGE